MESAFRSPPAGLTLFETMRWTPEAGVALLPLHLDRMQEGAARLGFEFDRDRAGALIGEVSGEAELRLRLDMDRNGGFRLDQSALPAPICEWRMMIAQDRVRADDPWRGVKSSHRALYDRLRATLPPGVDEAVLLNDLGRVAEGTITSVFVERDGIWLTPPLSDGALPGVLRRTLLDQGRAREASLAPADLRQGRVFLGNALRGASPARLLG